ncbi:hypothetical protein E2C01_053454 [Portunus trituberculatus]|uniref:Uncharacterized protein n=1 Tax=Portunus trituberculatus TaxID=210409 RepID=A0A5B7GPS0_PORTR|nr:hypothetical protein [Portunus trituberculatus]
MEFVNLWYLLICINDIFIILGSCLKIGLESKIHMPKFPVQSIKKKQNRISLEIIS